jgi:uncharacterized membrane protein YraQ (UPF0718 family)
MLLTIRAIKKIPHRYLFLAGISLAYLLTAIFNINYALSAFFNTAKELWKILPLLILVFAMMAVINRYVKPSLIKKHLGQDAGFKGWLYAFFGAMIFVGPPYVIIPLLGDLKKQGMKNALLIVFLNNRAITPIYLPVMAHYFSWTYSLILFSLTSLTSIFSGLLAERYLK